MTLKNIKQHDDELFGGAIGLAKLVWEIASGCLNVESLQEDIISAQTTCIPVSLHNGCPEKIGSILINKRKQ